MLETTKFINIRIAMVECLAKDVKPCVAAGNHGEGEQG
jgi:hypothetical protein